MAQFYPEGSFPPLLYISGGLSLCLGSRGGGTTLVIFSHFLHYNTFELHIICMYRLSGCPSNISNASSETDNRVWCFRFITRSGLDIPNLSAFIIWTADKLQMDAQAARNLSLKIRRFLWEM